MISRKVAWLTISFLIALSMLIISCGEAAVEEKAGTEVAKEAPVKADTPKYGGTLTVVGSNPGGFDPRTIPVNFCPTLPITHETMTMGDWKKGPAGTGETDWQLGYLGNTDLLTGALVESWQLVDDETIVYNIRKGVKFQNKPPVNGREMTADDVVWNFEQEWFTEGTNLDIYFKKEDHLISATALDNYTVQLKFPAHAATIHIMENSERVFILPRDITDMYGNQDDWELSNGTGAYILSDYVPESQITFVRNPDYWQKDPFNPGNRLPYMNKIIQLVIPDTSTQQAAFRTGKLDMLNNVSWEDFEILRNQVTDLQNTTGYNRSFFIAAGREDKPDLPFHDLNVRRAMNLAVDQKAILNDYYKGHGVLVGWPFHPIPAHEAFYTPLEEMPESVQELFTYNPEKAKQLLTEAGYPDGFKTKITVRSQDVDYVSLLREYLLKVGIEMQIEPLESGAFMSVNRGRKYDEMSLSGNYMAWGPWIMHEIRADSAGNVAFFQDDKTMELYDIINRNLGRDNDKWITAVHDLVPYLLEQAWGIWVPASEVHTVWWPWLKNFHGALYMGYVEFATYMDYAWIDTTLKKDMGY